MVQFMMQRLRWDQDEAALPYPASPHSLSPEALLLGKLPKASGKALLGRELVTRE